MAKKAAALADRSIKRPGISDDLAESLRQRILGGEFQEGDQLVQETIAAEYQVSRMPVREALRQLEAGGFVELRLHRGAVVKAVPTEQIAELFELRGLLEADLLAHAIPRMRDEDLARARTILQQLETAHRSADVASYSDLNHAFHAALYAPSERVQTLAMVQSINDQTDRYVRLHLVLTGAADADADHRELLRLCATRDTDRAIAFLRNHIAETKRNLLQEIENRRSALP